MKVLYDSQIFDAQRTGGISRYFSELMCGLKRNGMSYELPLGYSENVYVQERRLADLDNSRLALLYANFLKGLDFRGKGRLYRLRNRVFHGDFRTNRQKDVAALMRGDFDVFHPTYYDPYFLDFLGRRPFVLTIHDMIYERYPELLFDVSLMKNKKILARRADLVIAVSERTKVDVMDMLGIPSERIRVIHHGGPSFGGGQIPSAAGIGGRYFLFTGSRGLYKNFRWMLLSLAGLLEEVKDVRIVCTGPILTEGERELISWLGLEGRVVHKAFRTDSEMYALYHGAVALIFPSYYEGFGMPILEAFDAGCPAVLADASCFREVAGDAALYFDPKDGEGIRSCCRRLLEDSSLRNGLVERGRRRSGIFSWADTVEKTVDVYRDALQKHADT